MPTDEELIEMYFENRTAGELAMREGMELRWLHRQWTRLRRGGRLPMGSRHNMAAGVVTKPTATPGPERMMSSMRRPSRVMPGAGGDVDGRPAVDSLDVHASDDPLLAALYREHRSPRWDFFHHPPKQPRVRGGGNEPAPTA